MHTNLCKAPVDLHVCSAPMFLRLLPEIIEDDDRTVALSYIGIADSIVNHIHLEWRARTLKRRRPTA